MDVVDPVVTAIARAGLTVLFGVAALHKLRDFSAFTATVRDYQLVPDAMASPSAIGLLIAEAATVAALTLPIADPLGSLFAIALLALYSTAIALNLARGRRGIDCGCLGPAHHQPLSAWLLLRNAGVALGAALLVSPGSGRALGWIDALSVVGAVCMLIVLWNAVHQLAATPLVRRRIS